MKLGAKHQQQTVTLNDFSGGLNTIATVEGIGANQLYYVENMEVDQASGRLRSVAGTRDVVKREGITGCIYDTINSRALIICGRKVYYDNTELGELSGDLYPIGASWEDGILIASGGKLQYYNGSELKTITTSPSACTSVYVRAGRVLVSCGDSIRYSGIGDEENWTEDSNDQSSSKFVEAGYKDGSKFLGMASLSQYVIIAKTNRHIYQLNGEYPNWAIAELSRNVDCTNRLGICSVADAVFILGKNSLQAIGVNQYGGDMKANSVSTLVQTEIQKLPAETKVRYIAPQNQLWLIGNDARILVFDLTLQAWYERRFNARILDAFVVEDEIFVVKEDRISQLDGNVFEDNGIPLKWKFRGQRLVSQHEFLLKRTVVSFVPMSEKVYSGEISVGAVIVSFPIPTRQLRLMGNRSRVWKNRTKIAGVGRGRGVYFSELKVRKNQEVLHGSREKIFNRRTIMKESRNVFRSKYLDVRGEGYAGGIILQEITIEIAEV